MIQNLTLDWLTVVMLAGCVVAAGALGYAAYRHFADHRPWLMAGTWQPPEPIWLTPDIHFNGGFSPPSTITTAADGWQITPRSARTYRRL